MRIAICIQAGEAPGLLAPAVPLTSGWIPGGVRTLHELAGALALAGHDVELRGFVLPSAVQEIEMTTGGRFATPLEPREARAGELVVTNDGHPSPRDWATFLLSPARTVVLLSAPPGLFGWDFGPGWRPRAPDEIDPAAVGRPEHLAAMHAAGFELWTNNRRLATVAADAGVPCTDIGRGTPTAFPRMGLAARRTDVAFLADNRWSALAEAAVAPLGDLVVDRIPALPHPDVLGRIAAARVLVHLPRIEGHSRVITEARAVGAVPVGLRSNRFAAGLREEEGGVAVEGPEDVAGVVRALLADDARRERLVEAGRRTVADELAWEPYVARVARAAAQTPAELPGRVALGRMGQAITEDRQRLLAEVLEHRARLEAAS